MRRALPSPWWSASPAAAETPRPPPLRTRPPRPCRLPRLRRIPTRRRAALPLPALADIYGYGVKVQLEPTRNKKILNASPLVRNADYCQAIGQPGAFCRTRHELDPQRVPCDHYISGMSDENRPGPTWYEEVRRASSSAAAA